MLRARLKVIGGKHRGKTIPLMGAKFLIGREHDCQLRPTSELISRHHCAVTVDEFTVRLRDLGSTNGTFVNEQRVHGQVTLKSGDVIRVGKLRFEIMITELSEEEARKISSSGSATALADILSNSDTTEMSGSETAHDVRLPLVGVGSDSALNQTISGDSQTFELSSATTPKAPAAYDSAAADSKIAEPETTVASHQTLVPAETGYHGGMPQPYQQPGVYAPMGGYPPPQYPQMPMPYPPMPYGYPQPGMYTPQMYPPLPQMPGMYPSQQLGALTEVPPEEPSHKSSADNLPPVTLPDPSKTGVKSVPPAPAPEPSGDVAPSTEQKKRNPSQEAADIIRQHMQRRPGT